MNIPGKLLNMDMNKSFTLLLIGFLFATGLMAQVAANRYIVYFTDKDNTPFSISNPSAYLSEKAIERRLAQEIAIDERDLPVDPAYVEAVQDLGEVEILYRLKWSNAILIETIDPDVIQGVTELSGVDRLEVSRVLTRSIEPTPEPVVPAKDNADYGPSLNQIEMLNGLGLHEDGFRGEGIWIAVLDGGFINANSAAVFDSLYAEQRVLSTYNFVDQNTEVYQRSTHGTSVLSTMAGNQVDSLIGTAPDASYILEITENVLLERRIEEAFWEAGAEYADSVGADIITSSLGYTTFDVIDDNYNPSQLDGNTALITRIADVAASRGMLVINSAGNSGNNPWHFISFPADGDSVMAVGAVYGNEIVTGFSSRGPSADGRVKPNVMAQGGFTVITDGGGGIQTGNGTSFAAPVLAGMAACLWQAFPEATAWEVFQSIEESSSLFEMPNDSMGYGIPDFQLARQLLDQVLDLEHPIGLDKIETLRLSPNPYNEGQIRAEIPGAASTAIDFFASVYSLSGKAVLDNASFSSLEGFERELANTLKRVGAGVYLVYLKPKDKRVLVGKIVVQ